MDYYSRLNQFSQFNQGQIYNQQVKAVHGIEGAKAANVAPGCSVILPDDCEKIMYFISADQYGIKTVAPYPYGDVLGAPQQTQPSSQPQSQAGDSPVYVTTGEFDDLKNTVAGMKSSLDKLMEDLK